MTIKFYSHEFKLFIVGILAFLIIHYSDIIHINLPRIHSISLISNQILGILFNLLIYSLIISLVTYKLFSSNEPGKYYIIWFWSIFISYYFFDISLNFPFKLGIFTGSVLALFFSIPPSLLMSAIRYKKGKAESSLPTHQLWLATIMFASLIILSIYTGIKITFFLYGAFVGLLLSFLALGSNKTLVNLSLIPMFVIAIKYTGNTLYHVTPLTLLLIFSGAFLVFWTSMKPAIIVNQMTGEVNPIGVVSSRYFSLFLPIIIAVLWFIIRLIAISLNHAQYISPLTLNTFPLVFTPTVICSTLADYLRGRELNKIVKQYTGQEVPGIIGGVGLADGLWLDLVGVMIYYLTVIKFAFLDGTLYYLLFVSPIIIILTRFS
ncbi:hypothetical protein EWF20_11365 [Sulfolobus sp. S-194]|uniref:hypothetical protein n=1 Tax=Sulfolobus sp. S-194 TaxID=2512240 RepID=UPI0014373AFD|nr:hypothetical protein [Sulfolobus sp. S-194]QIW24671.1 hypothetical protein EWF20_11365 [Sulfolobus sp. S-194]